MVVISMGWQTKCRSPLGFGTMPRKRVRSSVSGAATARVTSTALAFGAPPMDRNLRAER